MAQLKSAAHAGSPIVGATGKNEKTKLIIRNASVMSLSGAPNLPRLNRRGSNCSPRSLLSRKHPTETIYEKISAALDTEMIALSATSDPKLMAARINEIPRHTKSALSGMSHPGRTCMIQFEQGKPLSLANAQHCLEAAAMTVMVEKNVKTTRSVPSMQVPAYEFVTRYTTSRTGTPVVLSSTSSTLVMQKLDQVSKDITLVVHNELYQNVISMTMPMIPLNKVAHIIALGNWSEASCSSSLI